MDRRQVLVVDDDEDVVGAITVALERDGLGVRVARNAVQALALADVCLPDLVVLDLVMPVSGGWDLVRRFREEPRCRRVPLILMSAHPALDEEAARLGVDHWLRKPFQLDQLLAEVRSRVPDANGPGPIPPP